MKSIYELTDLQIAFIFIGSFFFFAFVVCLGFCGLSYGKKKKKRRRSSSSSGGAAYFDSPSPGASSLTLVKEQSKSVLRGEHPITFVLPTVPVSEASGSDFSDLDSLSSPSQISRFSSSVSSRNSVGSRYMSDAYPSRHSSLSSIGETSHLDVTVTRKDEAFLIVEVKNLVCFVPSALIENEAFVKVVLLPDKSTHWETKKLPLRSNVKNRLEYKGESFKIPYPADVSSSDIPKTPLVLKFTVVEQTKLRTMSLGYAILEIKGSLLNTPRATRNEKLRLHTSVSVLLADIFSDLIEVSLLYENNKLNLKIIRAKIIQFNPDVHVYVKITLYDGDKVIQTKKTRSCMIEEISEFNESFIIILPPSYLDRVSCTISLCTKNMQGSKYVLGRTYVGSSHYLSGQFHWKDMIKYQNMKHRRWHKLT